MTTTKATEDNSKVDSLWEFSTSLLQSVIIVRWVGYGLLLLALLDFAEAIIPLQLMNPEWEFQTLGLLVERGPVPLIGLALVFLGGKSGRLKREGLVLRVLSWLALLVAVLFFLLVPLGVLDTVRIDEQNQQQLDIQLSEGVSQLQAVGRELENATTATEVGELLSLVTDGQSPDIENSQDLQAARAGLESALQQGEKDLNQQASRALSSQRRSLLKSSVKWNIGALISGVLFFSVWKGTGWARQPNRNRQKITAGRK